MRQITVFGANGKVGSLVVSLALKRNYRVVAYVHRGHNFSKHSNLVIQQGDIYNARDVAKAVTGSTMVISALGSWHTSRKDILTSGMKNIIPAMEKHGIQRIVTVTGAGAWDDGDHINILQKFLHSMLSKVAPKILHDGEEHIRLLRASNLDWTAVRSPTMTNWGKKDTYALRMKLPSPFATINRHSVATALLDLAASNQYINQSPVIYRR